MRRSFFGLALMAILLLPAIGMAGADTAVAATAAAITGPEKLEVSTNGEYNVKLYGPADVKWGFFVNLSGPQRGSASMTSPDGKTGDQSYNLVQQAALVSPEFNFTLTAPSKAGALLITVTAYAAEGSPATAVTRWSVDVRARREVTLNATVKNSGETPVSSLLVAFYVKMGGEWTDIGNQTVASIDGRGKANASLVWNSTLFDNGKYTIRVVIDPDHTFPQYSGAENTAEFQVELRTPGAPLPKPLPPGAYVLAGIVIAAVIVGVYYYRKKKIV
jgi:hypothetical protein